jgi:hypothetical protein
MGSSDLAPMLIHWGYWEMVADRTPVWKRHELVSKAIFEALLKQSNAENLEVKHDITIKGATTNHQIDVFWRFRMGGLDHSVIVQVKKQKSRAKKGDLLLFRDVLRDIRGQPKGVFVSEQGYQKGALEVARAAGITAVEIRELSGEAAREHITMTNLSIMIMTQSPEKSFALDCQILEPTVSNLRLSLDERWLAEHPQVLLGNARCSAIVSGIRFLDAEGNERTSMQMVVQDRVREFKKSGQTLLEVSFPDPTYASGIELLNQGGAPIALVDGLKITRLTATIEIKETTRTSPLSRPKFATYLLKNAVENDRRYVLVGRDGADLVAEVSLFVGTFRVG